MQCRSQSVEDHEIDIVPVDSAFFGEHDQTAKFVLILREHQHRWTEAHLVQNKSGQDVWVVKSCADMV